MCVANNHTGDFGKDAFARQLTMFDEAGLRHFGGGRNSREARRPLILERNGLRVALLGYNGFPPRSFAAGDDAPGVAWLIEDDVVADIRAAREKRARRRRDSVPALGARRVADAEAVAAGVGPAVHRRRRQCRHRRASARHADGRHLQRPPDRLQPGQLRVRLLSGRSARVDRLDREADRSAVRARSIWRRS